MKALEDAVRSIQQDGLVWGASKLVAVGYGIKKLQINLVVGTCFGGYCHDRHSYILLCNSLNLVTEDEKVSLDELQEKIAEFEDYVQSSDVAAMQSTCTPALSLTCLHAILLLDRTLIVCCTAAGVTPR
jgi:elongation factor 1-beta